MADSDCSNCNEKDCPFKKHDHYDCWNNKVIESKKLSSQLIFHLKRFKMELKTMDIDFINNEMDTLSHSVDIILDLYVTPIYEKDGK